MKHTSSQLKAISRKALDGNWGLPMGANIILGVISFIVIFFITFFTNTTTVTGTITSEFLTYAVSLFISLFGAGITKMTLNISRKQAYSMKDMLYVFHHNADHFLIVGLVIAGIGFVTGLPVMFMSMNSDIPVSFILFFSVFDLIISVIIDLFLGLSTYLLLDHPEMGAMDSMKESIRLMKGNKGRSLYITLSFLPLAFLSVLTCYIGMIWLAPYMDMTMANFYRDIIGELNTPDHTPTRKFPTMTIEENSNENNSAF